MSNEKATDAIIENVLHNVNTELELSVLSTKSILGTCSKLLIGSDVNILNFIFFFCKKKKKYNSTVIHKTKD